MSDPYTAIKGRIERRLGELQREAEASQARLKAEAAAVGALGGSRFELVRQEDARKRVQAAINWTLLEVCALPGEQNIWREVMASDLERHLSGFAKSVSPSDQFVSELLALTKVELDEFQAGVWRPSEAQAAQPSVHTTNNAVYVHGSVQGAVQQAGDHATLNASVQIDTRALSVALDRFEETLERVTMDAQVRDDLLADVATLRAQLRKAQPSRSVIQATVSAIRDLAVGVAAGLLASDVQALLQAVGLA
jgi:hypothetical protein